MYQGDSVESMCLQGDDAITAEILALSDLSYGILLPTKAFKFCSAALNAYLGELNYAALSEELSYLAEELSSYTQLKLELHNQPFEFKVTPLSDGCFLLVANASPQQMPQTEESALVATQIDQELALLKQGLALLADCNLDLPIQEFKGLSESELGNNLHTTVANLTEAIKQISKSCAHIIETTSSINTQSQDLSERSQLQSSETVNTSRNMEELRTTVADNTEHAAQAVSVSEDAVQIAATGHESLKSLIDAIERIYSSSQQMNKIIETVDLIAFQTNILSLNAAVEAAHAGDHGRGFAIVAQEVRSLAKRSKAASSEIKELIHSTIDASKQARDVSVETDQVVSEMTDKINTISLSLTEISKATQDQSRGVEQVGKALTEITTLADHNSQEAVTLSNNTDMLAGEVRQMQDVISVFRLSDSQISHPLHDEIAHLVQRATDEIRNTIEESVENRYISIGDLFDRDYQFVPDTNPERYNTRFDRYTDDHVLPIQEEWLNSHPALVYLIISDDNGYVPTHNVTFSQPLTGDPEIDIAKNRTKRIFTDRVGQSVGKHKEPFLIQTYRRDTGELMFDLSVPLFINGQHWGGVRAGYRIMGA